MAQIQRESAALDELLGEQVVEDVGVGAVPAAQVGADTMIPVVANSESWATPKVCWLILEAVGLR